ncbi:MAG: DNA polymerase, partial [Nitrososphaerota archaeon]
AITDAKIAYHAYTSLRDFFIKKYELDILHFATIPSIAGYIFRRKYLRECPTPVRIVETPINQRSNGKWYRVISKSPVYAGSLDVRYMALSAYHGARVESFCRGRLESVNLVYYDVDSLYPSSCMLQPLPCKDTEWIKLPIDDSRKQQEIITRGEGFVEVEFSFPSSINYPCLPVIGIRDNVLYFPLSGISYATLSELRLAIKLGLNRFKILSGFAFMPTSKEINHPLKQYMMALHELKHKSSKGSIDYQMYKLLMNALVGKLIERQEDDTSLTLLKEGFISRENYTKVTRRIKSLKHAGSLFLPEYASLILGKARSIIGEFVAKGSLFVSTDSVLLPANVDISCDALRELKSVGSNLKKEFNVTHGIIIRSRLYALNPLEDNPNNRHIARHGVHLSVGDFLVGMRQAYFSKSIPNLEYTAKKLIRLNEAIRKGIPLNTEVEYQSKINLSWDGKRNLLKLVDNPFADFSLTRPLLTIPNERKKKKKSINIDAVISLLNEGLSQRKIAKELGVTQQYISKLLKEVEDAKFSYKKL